jgi:predicted MFS family arabinose efflux permease
LSRSVAVALSRWRGYSWLVAILALVVVTTSNGMINSGLTVFDESLLDEFGCSVAQLKTRDSITFLGGSLFVVAAGWLVDRFGFKPILVLGMALLSCGYFFYSHAQSLAQLYVLHILFAAAIALAGNMSAIVTAATWMPKKRGLAVGMAIAGTSVGGMLIPPLANALNSRFGWREAMRLESLWPIVMIAVLVVALRNRPVGDAAGEKDADAATGASEGMVFREAVRLPQFYQVALAGALTYYAILSLFSHLFLYMRSLDFEPSRASLGLSALSLSALIGKLGSGWISDRIDPYRLLRLQMFTMLGGLLGVTIAPGLIWFSLVVTGLGWGSLHTLYNFILITLFGLRDAGKINGSVSLAEAAGGGLGILLTGIVHDLAGGYPGAFGVVCGVMLIAGILTLRLRPPTPSAAS